MAFRAVYLLRSSHPRYRGRAYVGFTTDPARRLRQHNGGRRRGGAWRTSGRGPWEMVLYVHGFPSDVAALRFEWAWQHPTASRRLRDVTSPRRRKEQPIAFALRLLPHLLAAPPWRRLPLRLRWLRPRLCPAAFPAPPPHVTVDFDAGDPRPRPKRRPRPPRGPAPPPPAACCLCGGGFEALGGGGGALRCPRGGCGAAAHPPCLASDFLRREPHELLPLRGPCPRCHEMLLWGDLIRHHLGHHDDSEEEAVPEEDPALGHWTDELLVC